jgi:hypothetical protein
MKIVIPLIAVGLKTYSQDYSMMTHFSVGAIGNGCLSQINSYSRLGPSLLTIENGHAEDHGKLT